MTLAVTRYNGAIRIAVTIAVTIDEFCSAQFVKQRFR
jgi:hypothetical protein